MFKSDFIKQQHYEFNEIITDFNLIKLTNPLVKEIKYLDYDIDIDWIESLETIVVNGIINFTLKCIDSRTGEEFEYTDFIDWNDEYSFNDSINDQSNIILGEEFDILNYVVEQLNINLPYNLSNNSDIINKIGSGWALLSEEEFNQNEQNKLDPRWAKLNEFEKK